MEFRVITRLLAVCGAVFLSTAGLTQALGSPGSSSEAFASRHPSQATQSTQGGVVAWGANEYGQSTVPSEARAGVNAIATSGTHSLAIKDGRVIAWGRNDFGQTDVPPDAQSGVTAIAAGLGFSLAVKDGRVISWGREKAAGAGLEGVTDVSASGSLWAALASGRVTESRRPICGSPYGQAMPGEATNGVTAIATGQDHHLAVKGGRILAWGAGCYDYGQDKDSEQLGLSGMLSVAAGTFHSVAMSLGGRVVAWGKNDSGQTNVPTILQAGASAIAAGSSYSLAIKDGAVISWGSSTALGARVPAAAKSGIVAIAAAGNASLAIGPASIPPGVPSGVQADPGDSRIDVSWLAPTSGGAPSRYVATAQPGDFSCSSTSALRCTISGLSNGTAYTLTVTAFNESGASPPSAPAVSATPRTVPAAPIEVVARATDGSALVSWLPPLSDGGSPIIGYSVTASPGTATCSTTGSLSCSVTGLTNGTAYTFTVTAENVAGASAPSEPSTSVIPSAPIATPGSVTSLKAIPGKGFIRVTWSSPANMGGAKTVNYEYQVGKQPWTSTASTFITVKGKKGSRIIVKVRAVNTAGFGPSVSVSGVPR